MPDKFRHQSCYTCNLAVLGEFGETDDQIEKLKRAIMEIVKVKS